VVFDLIFFCEKRYQKMLQFNLDVLVRGSTKGNWCICVRKNIEGSKDFSRENFSCKDFL
jgi:hypothetical protein